SNAVVAAAAAAAAAATLTTSLPRLSAKTTNLGTVTRPRPQPIAGTPPPDPNEKCDTKIIQQTCSLFGLDLERPPPVPPSRNYTVTGNTKLCFPQNRIMKMNFPEDTITNPPTEQLKKGESVTVVGASTCRGHLIVEHKGQNFHVPFQYMELVRGHHQQQQQQQQHHHSHHQTANVTNTNANTQQNANNVVNCNSNNNNNGNNNNLANNNNVNSGNNNNNGGGGGANNGNNVATSAAVKI
ncbi:rho GTPase-activating protein gacK-like, partial [Lucilia sericata]|uniref:rho GTPase-activating protein gacK-like n=1 Tax=Lucilia sericata TaxID=13632 RepID=UPI0018A81F23